MNTTCSYNFLELVYQRRIKHLYTQIHVHIYNVISLLHCRLNIHSKILYAFIDEMSVWNKLTHTNVVVKRNCRVWPNSMGVTDHGVLRIPFCFTVT